MPSPGIFMRQSLWTVGHDFWDCVIVIAVYALSLFFSFCFPFPFAFHFLYAFVHFPVVCYIYKIH